MTAPTDCEPLWTDDEYDRLSQRGAEFANDAVHPRHRDLLGQLTRREIRTMTDVPLAGAWL